MNFNECCGKFNEKLLKRLGVDYREKIYLEKNKIDEKESEKLNIFYDETKDKNFYWKSIEITDEQHNELRQIELSNNIRTIKNCLIFFAVFTAISFGIYLFAYIKTLFL